MKRATVFSGLWRETDRTIFKGDKVIVGCGLKDYEDDVEPFCIGFVVLPIDSEAPCPKCGCPIRAKKDPDTLRVMGMVPVMIYK